MNFKYLCQQYGLGRFQTACPMDSGTVARVWKLTTDQGAFLVRSLTEKEQGEREWKLHQHLRGRGFTAMPAILVPYFEQDGLWYQVQTFLDGTMPDPAQPGMAAAMADTAKRLTAALADYPSGTVIHGDLGPWNLLKGEDGQISVIDFGEVRPGDPCFDYAALLAGIINHAPAEARETACREFLAELDCDRTGLLEQLRLWAAEGICRWTGKNENMVSRFHHALNWAEEHLPQRANARRGPRI